MKALAWHGRRDVRIDTVPDPTIQDPTDVIIEMTSSGICGSDLHLYDVLTMFLHEGDILGHEPVGRVVATGPEVTDLHVGDRIVVPFNISCGHCFMCDRQLFAQCETTQVVEQDKGAALYGYTELYGSVPGGQAEFLRVPHADFGAIEVGDGHDDRTSTCPMCCPPPGRPSNSPTFRLAVRCSWWASRRGGTVSMTRPPPTRRFGRRATA